MKKLSIVILVIIALFAFGCKKEDTSNNMVKLNRVDISSISNTQLKNFINEASQKEGVYQINTKSNTYIFFNGIENEFTDIKCSLDNKTLNIESNKNKLDSSSPSQNLYVIYQKNTTITNDKAVFFDTIKLVIDNKESNFENVFVENRDI